MLPPGQGLSGFSWDGRLTSSLRQHLFTLALMVAAGLGSSVAPPAWAGAYQDILDAVHLGNREALGGLLAKGMDPNTADSDGTTLLMHAAQAGDLFTIEILLSFRCNALKRNRFGDTALNLASLNGHLEAVQRLVAAGAETNPQTGWTPLLYAVFNGHAAVAGYLLEQGADVDQRGPNGMTPLMVAVRNQNAALVALLLAADADEDLKDFEGRTALAQARALASGEIAELLLNAGAQD